jgi:hypothetical protein
MPFVQIGFLGALAALAIPIIIHLVFRQRPKRVELGTLRFLRIVLEQNARRRHVMRWLLLALRLACVALLAFLFARPYLLALQPAGEKQTVVVLIDSSASMELKQDGLRAIERGVAAAKELLETEDNSRFEIAFFDHRVQPLSRPGLSGAKGVRRDVSPGELAARLVAPAACHGATDYGAAMEWARDVLAKAPPGPRQLHVFTDFQRSGLAWSEVDALPPDIATYLHDLGRPAVNNLSVTEARAERAWLRDGEQTAIHVTVYNGSPFGTDELGVVLRLAASPLRKLELREQVKVEAGAMQSLRFDLPPLAEGLWQGTVALEAEDDLPLDNQRDVALLASPPYQVLLVDGRPSASPLLSSTYLLEAALRLADPDELNPSSPFEPRRIAVGDPLPKLDKFDGVVLSDVGELDAKAAQRIAEFVEGGGGLLVFCGENVTADRVRSLEAAGLTVGPIEGVERASDLPLRLKHWDAQHPIFSAFSDPQLGDLQRLPFSAATQIAPSDDALVLAEFASGRPAVIERRLGQGSVIWFTSTCDRAWGEWARSRLYLPLVYQFLGHQTGLLDGGRVRQEVLDRAADLAAGKEAADGGSADQQATKQQIAGADLPPGIHAKEGYTLVVGQSPREAETDRCEPQEFANRFGLKPASEAVAQAEAAPPPEVAGTELMDSEIWPWLAMLLLVTVVLEGFVANRTAA